MPVLPAEGLTFEIEVLVLIIGAGASGLVAALAAKDAGVDAVVLERDPILRGSTALSSGMIPACGTRVQIEHGIEDSVEIMAADIAKKSRNQADSEMIDVICRESGPAIDWLATHGVELTLVEGFLYPGHSRLRMHAPASRSGSDLMDSLSAAAARAGIDILTGAHVTDLFADSSGRIHGVRAAHPDGSEELIGCKALILACNGFGGNPEMVHEYIPTMENALYFGHEGNQGDAILWGQALGADTKHLGSYQGHGSVAHPHGVLISWALMMEGGFQVNAQGQRFSNEHDGYSEQARRVISQEGSVAWDIFDDRQRELVLGFEDFRQSEALGAVQKAATIAELADITGASEVNLRETFKEVKRLATGGGNDTFGRSFTAKPTLQAPFYAIKVTGSLFHTQGGLVVDVEAHALNSEGGILPNLFASGGAACGVSGPEDWGYLSGNGLLTAVSLGRVAGKSAADLVLEKS
jgi:fumarate reductase flavoprotein subunit